VVAVARGPLVVILLGVLQCLAEKVETDFSLISTAPQHFMVVAGVVKARDITEAMADRAEVVEVIPAFTRMASRPHNQARQTRVEVEVAAPQGVLPGQAAPAS
jgi:hypothetical protein|tara:strand:- start:42 stop:350 length:309 start_codon:yes stop_codon:yes gene_type:complete